MVTLRITAFTSSNLHSQYHPSISEFEPNDNNPVRYICYTASSNVFRGHIHESLLENSNIRDLKTWALAALPFCWVPLFFFLFIFHWNDGGIVFKIFSLLWKCGVVYSHHFPVYLISRIFYFIATFYFILFFENSRQWRTFQDYLSMHVDHTN